MSSPNTTTASKRVPPDAGLVRGTRPVAIDPGEREARTRPPAARQKGRPVRLAGIMSLYGILAVGAFIVVFPYILILLTAAKPMNEIFSSSPWQLPQHPTFATFRQVWIQDDFGRILLNTVAVTVVITACQVACSTLAAYAFARLSFPGREALFWVYLATMMVPNAVTVVPLYLVMRELHLLNTYYALVLPYAFGTPYIIFLMRQFFRTIPRELHEAAKMDGCSEVRVLLQIILPLSRAIITTATIIVVVSSWNNFLWPLIAVNSQARELLTVGLAALQSNFGTQWDVLMAGSCLTLLPLVLFFAIFQRQIVRSIQMTGGLK